MYSREEKKIRATRRARRSVKTQDAIVKIVLWLVVAGLVLKWLKELFMNPATWFVVGFVALLFGVKFYTHRKAKKSEEPAQKETA